jgi:hypothetical protein
MRATGCVGDLRHEVEPLVVVKEVAQQAVELGSLLESDTRLEPSVAEAGLTRGVAVMTAPLPALVSRPASLDRVALKAAEC